jgi:hypothetical protein
MTKTVLEKILTKMCYKENKKKTVKEVVGTLQ